MLTSLSQRLGIALVAGLAFAATGCDPFTSLDFTDQTATPPGDHLEFRQIRITEGRAIGFVATPMEGSDPMDKDTTVALESNDPDVCGLGPSVEPRSFVIFGAHPGSTRISVTVNDNFEGEIPVDVVEAK